MDPQPPICFLIKPKDNLIVKHHNPLLRDKGTINKKILIEESPPVNDETITIVDKHPKNGTGVSIKENPI